MKRVLKRTTALLAKQLRAHRSLRPEITGSLTGVWGDVSGVYGDLSGACGDVSGIRGDLTGVCGYLTGWGGDLDLAEINPGQREVGVTVSELIE